MCILSDGVGNCEDGYTLTSKVLMYRCLDEGERERSMCNGLRVMCDLLGCGYWCI